MRLLFVRPPKHLWPYMNEQDNYLLPQALVCLGAAARQAGHDVTLLDCMPIKMGWRSLENAITALKPQAVLCGDSETMFAQESGRVFQVAKSVDPSIVTIAGGVHFANAAEHSFSNFPIDAIVSGEGELTMLELLQAVESGTDLRKVRGLILPDDDGKAHYTPPRPLIDDLDALPFPAYDLLPLDKYGTARYLFSPGGVTIHHSRGCINGCAFCACWLQMAAQKKSGDATSRLPRWRTRSVTPVVEEMEYLARRHDKYCQVFVDDVWNADPDWSARFADELSARNLGINWFAFMRADHLIRDEASGLFGKLIASGLTHICVGLERAEGDELDSLDKHNIDLDQVNRIVPKLRKRYPSLFLQTTFIVGLRQDSARSLDRLLNYVETLDPDYPAFHPITPVPGTKMWREAKEKGWLEIEDFARYDWMTPVMPTESLSREELEAKIWQLNGRYMRPLRILRGLFSRHTYRRRMYIWWLLVSLRVGAEYLMDRLLPSRSSLRKPKIQDYTGMIRPDWYDR